MAGATLWFIALFGVTHATPALVNGARREEPCLFQAPIRSAALLTHVERHVDGDAPKVCTSGAENFVVLPARTRGEMGSLPARLRYLVATDRAFRHVVATVTNVPATAHTGLCSPRCRYATLVIQAAADWPGNMFKLWAFRTLAEAFPGDALILIADASDVIIRNDVKSIFETYRHITTSAGEHLFGKDVIISAERGYGMLLTAGANTRTRFFSHGPEEWPDNFVQGRLGIPNQCPKFPTSPATSTSAARCTHFKFPNAGLLIGTADGLRELYTGSWGLCELCSKWESGWKRESEGAPATPHAVTLHNTSEQNLLGHYLRVSQDCGGRCSLDMEMALVSTASYCMAEDFAIHATGGLMLRLPGMVEHGFLLRAAAIHTPKIGNVTVAIERLLQPSLVPAHLLLLPFRATL